MSLLGRALFAHGVPPNILHNLGATQIAPTPTILVFGVAALYLFGVRRYNQLHPGSSWSKKRTWALVVATLVTFIAIELVPGVYDDVLFYDHMIQHLLLVMLAAVLYAMAAPLELLLTATTGATHRVVARALSSKVAEAVGHPIFALAAYAVMIPVTHLTSLFNFTLTNELAHDNEHLAFLVVGYLFWRPVVAIEPCRHPLHPGLRLAYLALAVPVDTFTGVALISASHEMFPFYDTFSRAWGPSLVSDLHTGGSIMWFGGDGFMAFAMVPAAVRWVRYEEKRALELDERLDAEPLDDERLDAGASASGDRSGAGRQRAVGESGPRLKDID